eukprot:CAMPEP_0202901382 /NCGR_PEP_ID=MMETSP1392-20130828/14223_1 /ASSEMBLY_ACC=CAM_ASM_000868 /TAXON_ID=225041 /ORGANISM="Chlamydomonas chlamydogama, Strain SAG 11-48b" /LENGTH=141 /DNA_ID=CAMNT_0049587937 /DNA_START=71 /DNA_END=496 /DNA_ORIENTATION=-
MAGLAPESVQGVEKAIQGMIEDIQKLHLLPRQKQAFLCCAQCCDNTTNMQQVQSCVERCTSGPAQFQKIIQANMAEFQERFQRCVFRCQDLAKESMSFDATPAEQSLAEQKFKTCFDACGKEFQAKIPKLRADIEGQLKKV